MKRGGIIHAHLAAELCRLGHTDTVVVADSGLPIPPGVAVVDLALVFGIPRFVDVLDALREECVFEGCTAAAEARGTAVGGMIEERFPQVVFVPHDDLKRLTAQAKLVVRTGEATAFSNVLLRCGVPF
jgi:D-ribose pyranase